MTRKLLIVEDDPGLRAQMKWSLADYEVLTAGDRAEALAVLRREQPPVVLLDLGLPPDPDGAGEGLAALEAILQDQPGAKVIICTGNDERANALKAVAAGAYDFCHKPVDPGVLALIVGRALALYDLEEENRRLAAAHEPSPLAGVVAASPAMLAVCRAVERVARADVAVLVTGESGTGKEVFATAIHRLSARARGPFIAINCAAIPENLLESELFGHEKGAFTGAVKQTIGKVEQASGGTLFLDEIGDMPLPLQAKLLRFLQQRVIERVGGRKPIEVDVRVVSATNRDLAAMMAEGGFREDLFYRLNEVGIHIPPLRDRPGDAVLLARFFLKKHAQAFAHPPQGFAADAVAALATYGWPGNVRELENRVRRAMLMAEGKQVTAADLALPGAEAANGQTMPPLRKLREQADTEAVIRALALSNDNVTEAAHLLGISRPTLYDLMRAANIRRKDSP